MKKIVFLFSIAFYIPIISQSQIRHPWIFGNDTYMWPGYIEFANRTIPSDLSYYKVISFDEEPGIILTNNCPMFRQEAMSVAYQLLGDYGRNKHNVAKDRPNIIPYKGGAILYIYSHERKRWELFNVIENGLLVERWYKRFDFVKK